MNVSEAIQHAVEYFRSTGSLKPSHCDCRCFINDATADNPRICRKGYDQTRAWMKIRKALGNPVSRNQAPY